MRTRTVIALFFAMTTLVAASACGGSDPQPNTPPGAYTGAPGAPGAYPGAPPAGAYTGAPPNGGYAPAPGAPNGGYTPAPGPAAPAAAPMSTPGPAAFACSNDAACLTHRCNTSFGKCAAPCQGPQDCQPTATCTAGLCVPKLPGQP